MYAVIHVYNSESLKDISEEEKIVRDNAVIHEDNCESLMGMPHKTANCGGVCSYSCVYL